MATIRVIEGKKGKKYQAIIRMKGFKPLYKVFDKKSLASDWARKTETLMLEGKYKPLNTKKTISPILTVSDLIDDFEKNVAPKHYSRPEQYKVMYDWWKEQIGNIPVADLDTPTLVQCRNALAAEAPDKPYKNHTQKSNSTVRKYMFALSAVLRYATRSLKIIDRNPMSDVDKPKKNRGVIRFLTDEEKELLLEGCKLHSDRLFMFVMLALFSGGRYSELLHLKVENLDRMNNLIQFTKTKNGEARGVPVYSKLMEMLQQYLDKHNIKSGFIFANPDNKFPYLKGAFEQTVKKVGIKNFRFHDCRHTYATWLAENGATLLEIATLLGHKTLNQVQIYSHLTKKTTSKLVRKMTANKFDF